MRLPIGSRMDVCALLLSAVLVGCAEEQASLHVDASMGASSGQTGGADAGGADAGPREGGTSADGASADGATADAGALQPGQRLQDTRKFTIDEAMLTTGFDALPDAKNETDRWTGVIDNAGYRIEVPKNWNGVLVMYAHGYGGEVPVLRVTSPRIRRHLVDNGYAWAASSYSTNYYDVRAGVEDTNKLALQFTEIAAKNGRTLSAPTKRYIIGHSMGGHVSGAAIEKEVQATANNKVRYDAAMPMCGVLGDTELFDYFAAYQAAAHQLTGIPVPPAGTPYAPIAAQLKAQLFTNFPSAAMPVGTTTPLGDKLKAIVMNLTGGKRAMFELGFASTLQGIVWNSFGGDGSINGVLTASVIDTTGITYQLDSDPALSAEEMRFNDQVYRAEAEPGANDPRPDGLRWIPIVHGEFDVPVVSLHTLGDLFVPFHMEQIYRRRAEAKGSADKLVQRAVRGTGHCEFTNAEEVAAFEALVAWETDGVKPEGDDVLDPATVGADDYGCKFTDNTFSADEMAAAQAMSAMGVVAARKAAPPCPAP